ncbi:MAG: 1-acyl-sn-glycerol-3-phosphate acyltransferase [Actinobacteria bacterium]|nr:1-acyl-sn-glycerol-3-phosphate acyltransferase [Actinomycetota bacterium]
MEYVYRPVIGVALGLFKALSWQIRTFGTDNIPTSGPVVLASNHIGYLDFVFVGYAARERGRLVRFMAKKEVFDHPVAGPLMRGMKHIPVDRFARASDAVDLAIEYLRRGEAVGMFPEGTISRSFVPRAGKTGAARMAIESGAALIPCATWGTQRILTKDRPKNFQRKVALDVYAGEPVEHERDSDPTEVTGRVMEAIGSLVEKAQANYPQEPTGPSDKWWLPAHMGGTAPTVEEADRLAERDRERRKRARRQEPS